MMYILTQDEMTQRTADYNHLRNLLNEKEQHASDLRRVILNLLDIKEIPSHEEWLNIIHQHGKKGKTK